MTTLEEFRWRGLLHTSSKGLADCLAKGSLAVYAGFDPSAPSLHVGSLLPLMGLARMQRMGHRPIGLLGGATGLIGDPSGKSQERPLLSREQVETNTRIIRNQIKCFLDPDCKEGTTIVDNGDWLRNLGAMDFLRDVGKYFPVSAMLGKESVRRRLASDTGISYTEFSYMLLQAYDFLVLFDNEKCRLQLGGTDQWGNITAGIELIRRARGAETHGMVFPLLTNSTGKKFGKTESGTIWLSAELTSPYRFYQFWYRTEDQNVEDYLKTFTWLRKDKITRLCLDGKESNSRRAHRALARELTAAVHGETALHRAEKTSQALFGGDLSDLSNEEISDAFSTAPSIQICKEALPMRIRDLVVQCGLSKSKGAATRLMRSGGLYVNNKRAVDDQIVIDVDQSLHGRFIVIRKGKKNYCLVSIQGVR